ncbi:methyltransferase [Thiohalorhabdus sp.]|uniref:methyltransferase n=1 Tax=Thiohalorhabdus sp. TaxID=3094134 RepID=UPI002FC39864
MSPDIAAPSELAVTTNPGLEDVAAAELGVRLAEAGLDPANLELLPGYLKGRLRIRHPARVDELKAAAVRLRSAHHLLRPVARTRLPAEEPLAAIEALLWQVPVPELANGASFRVSCDRHGSHDFTSPDVERAAGSILVARFGARVDLTGFRVQVRVDIADDRCAVAVQLTRRALSHRFDRLFGPRVALKPNVAYACLRLGGLSTGTRRLLDPFCGSGTLLAEAGQVLANTELWGMDRQERAVAGTRTNLEAVGLADRLHVAKGDARRIGEHYPAGYFDAIVTNPPFGARMGRDIRFADFYTDLLIAANRVLHPGGTLVLLARQRGALHKALRRSGAFRVRQEQPIETNKVYPTIFVLTPES